MMSSTLTGERRWASARRGGMTVLGKVAVPKPLNLPSQRLENHGLDPNVEIVPKGTLSWGTRSSSTSKNAWGSSTLSPSAENANSPSYLSGRPSSSSGTRPSTSDSDKLTEATGNAWGPNSRPSSASGALASNQSSLTSLRPRSAETRPGSSQLSRFAEPVSDNLSAWGASVTAEKLGVVSSKKDDFSLSSGDFPTLGSDKDNHGKSKESKDAGWHSRPSSASGRIAQTKENTVMSHAEDLGGSVDTWRKDGSQSVRDGVQPSVEKWQGDPQQFFHPNIPPQHFDAWRGPPPMNAPAGLWYRGPPGGPPYGAPVGPGGFPIEPLPYFRPQIPPPAFASPQPAPPPRGGPRGYHPNSGNAYRPQIPDAYVRPGMPLRPGFYPPMTFDGYYGPPMSYGNTNERDIPFMGMGAGPSVYERFSAPNGPDSGDSHARAGGHGPSGKMSTDHGDHVHCGDNRGPYKVLVKQHNEWDGKELGENIAHTLPANASHSVKGEKTGVIPRKYEWGDEDDGEEDIHSSHYFDNLEGHVSETIQAKLSKCSANMKPVDDSQMNNSETVTLSSSQMPQVSNANGRDSSLPTTKIPATLMQKIEVLNAKVRAADGKVEYIGEEKICDPHSINAEIDTSINKYGKSAASLEETSASGHLVPMSRGLVASAVESVSRPKVVMPRKPYHGMSSRIDHHDKIGKSRNQESDGWQRKPVGELPDVISSSKGESAYNVQGRDPHQAVDAAGNNLPAKDEVELVVERAKMRELARQRAIQLQKEEEERTKEQKAKALAKLEELNRRMQSDDASGEVTNTPPANGTSRKEEEGSSVDLKDSATKLETSTLVSPLKIEIVAQVNENSGFVVGSIIPSEALPAETSKSVKSESVPHDESMSLKHDVNATVSDGNFARELNEGGRSRLKRTGYKQKQITAIRKNLNEKSIPVVASEAKRSLIDMSVTDVASNLVLSEGSLMKDSGTVSESSAPQRWRGSKSIENKNKQDDAPPPSTSAATTSSETIPLKTYDEILLSQASSLGLEFGSIQAAIYGGSGVELLEQCSSLPSEETHGRVNQGKSQHTRRISRNQQSNRFVDKFHGSDAVIWAPVRSQSKTENNPEATCEGNQKSVAENVNQGKGDNLVQSSFKGKRAEIERYVPKPVAKELAQQVGVQNLDSSLVNIATPDQNASQQPVSVATRSIGSMQSREGVSKHNKQGKVHGAWRQRGSTDLLGEKNAQNRSSSTLELHKNPHGVILQNQPTNLVANSAEAEKKSALNVSDCQVGSSNVVASAPDTSVTKDPEVTGKGSQHPSRGYRNMGNSHDSESKNISCAETDRTLIQRASDMNQSDRGIGTKETRGTGERMSSQWQPKFHANSSSNQKEGNIAGSQNVCPEASRVIKKGYPQHLRVKTPEEGNEIDRAPLDEYASENKVVMEVRKAGNHEPRSERKSTSSKGRPFSPNQNSVSIDESGLAASIDTQHERPFSAGSRRYGNHSGKGHEPRGDWTVQDSRKHDVPVNRDRQMHNMQYEYQRVGSYNNIKSNNFEGLADGPRNAGRRYRERGQIYAKRCSGNFHGRVQVDAGGD